MFEQRLKREAEFCQEESNKQMSSEHSEYREVLEQDEHPASYDRTEPSYSIVAILGVLTVVALLIIGIGVQYYFESSQQSLVYGKVLSQPNWVLQDLRRKEAWELSHYTTWDKTKGTYRIPIDQAMKLVAQDSADNRVKYPTNPYEVKSAAQLAGTPDGGAAVSQPGAAAAQQTQNTGSTSSPNVQQPQAGQQPHK